MKCGYEWEPIFEPDGDTDCVDEDFHQCILEEDHEGEHECVCGETY
jgi:hypothetical protein